MWALIKKTWGYSTIILKFPWDQGKTRMIDFIIGHWASNLWTKMSPNFTQPDADSFYSFYPYSLGLDVMFLFAVSEYFSTFNLATTKWGN